MRFICYEKIRAEEDFDTEDIKRLIKALKKIVAKGGVVVITVNDQLITTYNLDSYNHKKALNSSY